MQNENLNQNTESAKNIWESAGDGTLDILLNNPFVVFIGKLILAIIVLIVLVIISKIISWTIKKKLLKNAAVDNEEYISKVANLVWDVIFYILLIFSIFISFQIIGFDLTILLWWLSFWIWFAFKEILWNMLAGILVLTTKDYRIWDVIEVKWVTWVWYDYFWHIEEITIRYTSIREFNNQKVIIPNLVLITNPVKTFTSEETIRWEARVLIGFKSDVKKATNKIIEAINSQPYITNKEDTSVICDTIGSDWINILVRYHYDPNWEMRFPYVRSRVNDIVIKTLIENDIDIAYTHRTLTLEKNDQNILKTILFAKK